MKKLSVLLYFISALAFIGCYSTNITSTWKAENAGTGNYKKILVLGIVQETDRNLREKMETHLVGDLQALGYQATSAYVRYGPKAFQNLSEEEALKKLQNEGVDAVLTVVLLDKERERRYVPGQIVYSPYFVYQGRLWGYYHTIYRRIDMAGYYQVSTNYFWESNLYELSTQKLVYSAQTKSFEPSSAEALAHEYGQLIVSNMVQNGVLARLGSNVAKAF